jgi:hypothetical protein
VDGLGVAIRVEWKVLSRLWETILSFSADTLLTDLFLEVEISPLALVTGGV